MPIDLNNIFYTYQKRSPFAHKALDDINTSFSDNSFTALIGRTGSGKSTLIEHLNGLLIADSGKIKVDDYSLDMTLEVKKNGKIDYKKQEKKRKKKIRDIKDLRKKVGVVFQFPEYQLFEESVIKDVAFGPKNFNYSEEEAIDLAKKALTKVGLDESFYSRSVFELSGGEKRRVAIAGILAIDPKYLVLDEPTVGLDAKGERDLMNLLSTLQKEGKSIILATHNMDVVLKYTNRVLVIDEGKIVKDCDPIKLFQDESFLSNSYIEPPKVFSFAKKLIDNNLKIDLEKVKDTSTLVAEIKRVKGL